MARFSLSFLSLFLVLAVLALSVPVKREELSPDQKLSLESALQDVKVCLPRVFMKTIIDHPPSLQPS